MEPSERVLLCVVTIVLFVALIIIGVRGNDINTRLDALEGEKIEIEGIAFDVMVHTNYLHTLRDWILHHHPDSIDANTITTDVYPPDPDTMPAVERLRPTLDSARQWMEENSAVDYGDSITPIYRFPNHVIPIPPWDSAPPHDNGGSNR